MSVRGEGVSCVSCVRGGQCVSVAGYAVSLVPRPSCLQNNTSSPTRDEARYMYAV